MTKTENVSECRIIIRGERVKQVNNFKYHGSNRTSDERCVTEVKCRIAQAKRTFVELDNVLKNKKITIRTRMRVLKCYVHPILQYGCETWTLNAELRRAINAFEMWCLRRMQRILYATRKTNEEILQQTGQKSELLKNLINRQLQFFGLVMRKQKLEHVVICGRIRGKCTRGRQCLKFMNQLKDVLSGSTEEILRAVNDRDGSRNKCSCRRLASAMILEEEEYRLSLYFMLYSLYVLLETSTVFRRSSSVTKGSETLILKNKFVERTT